MQRQIRHAGTFDRNNDDHWGLFLIQTIMKSLCIRRIKLKTKQNWVYSNPKCRNWVEAKIAYYCIQATTSTPKLSLWSRYREQTMIKYLWRAHFRHLTNQSLTATYQPQKWRESPCKTQFWRVISSRFGSQPWQCASTLVSWFWSPSRVVLLFLVLFCTKYFVFVLFPSSRQLNTLN